jgi:hypothetical protein
VTALWWRRLRRQPDLLAGLVLVLFLALVV